jgi:hypothetical protein
MRWPAGRLRCGVCVCGNGSINGWVVAGDQPSFKVADHHVIQLSTISNDRFSILLSRRRYCANGPTGDQPPFSNDQPPPAAALCLHPLSLSVPAYGGMRVGCHRLPHFPAPVVADRAVSSGTSRLLEIRRQPETTHSPRNPPPPEEQLTSPEL